jgi:hypothetical protein
MCFQNSTMKKLLSKIPATKLSCGFHENQNRHAVQTTCNALTSMLLMWAYLESSPSVSYRGEGNACMICHLLQPSIRHAEVLTITSQCATTHKNSVIIADKSYSVLLCLHRCRRCWVQLSNTARGNLCTEPLACNTICQYYNTAQYDNTITYIIYNTIYTERFIMFSVITNIYNRKT